MGLFDTYGQTQLKVGDVGMAEFKIGDTVPIADGVYLGWDGVVVIDGGRFLAEFDSITDTHAVRYAAADILDALHKAEGNTAQ